MIINYCFTDLHSKTIVFYPKGKAKEDTGGGHNKCIYIILT